MKKTLLIIISFLSCMYVCIAQVEPAAKLNASESNKITPPKEPTINGIPYSQYKAQQEAKKLQRQQPMQTPVMGELIVKISDNSVDPMEARKANPAPTTISPVLPENVVTESQSDPNSRFGALSARNNTSTQTFDPTSLQSPSNTGPTPVNRTGPDIIAQPKNADVPVVAKTQPTTNAVRPEVPEQFRLQTNQLWNGVPVTPAQNPTRESNIPDRTPRVQTTAPILTTSVKTQPGTSPSVKHEKPVLDAKSNNSAGVTNKPQATVQNAVTPGGATGVSVPTTGDPLSKQSPTPVTETPKDPTLKNGVPEKTKSE